MSIYVYNMLEPPPLIATLSFVITGRDSGVAKRNFQPKDFKLNLVKLKSPMLVVDDDDIVTELTNIKRIDISKFDVYNYNISGGFDGSKLDKIIENPLITIYSLITPMSQGGAEQFSGPGYPFTFNEKRTTLSAICDAVYKAQILQMPGYELVLTAVDLTRPVPPVVIMPPPKLQPEPVVLASPPKLQPEPVVLASPPKLQPEPVVLVSPPKLQPEPVVLELTPKQNKKSKRKRNQKTKQNKTKKRNKKLKRNQKTKRNKNKG